MMTASGGFHVSERSGGPGAPQPLGGTLADACKKATKYIPSFKRSAPR